MDDTTHQRVKRESVMPRKLRKATAGLLCETPEQLSISTLQLSYANRLVAL